MRNMLADYLSANSTLREIENEFDGAYVELGDPVNSVGGQRRNLVQRYYLSLDFARAADARKFLNALSAFMGKLERQIPNSPWGDSTVPQGLLDEFQEQLGRDGFSYQRGAIVPISAAARLADAKAIADDFDAAHISDQIKRIEASIDVDPALAIGTAKELVESCFKTILEERHISYDKDDLPQLGKKVFRALKLVPDDIPDAAKGSQTIRVLLSNLATVVQGIAEIRGLYGTGHGKEGRSRGVSPRHARLAVGAATALVTFALQTYLEQASESEG